MPAPSHDPLALADEHGHQQPQRPQPDPGPSPRQKRLVGTTALLVVGVALLVWGVLYAFGAGGLARPAAAGEDGGSDAKIQAGQDRVASLTRTPLGSAGPALRVPGGTSGLPGGVRLQRTTISFSSDGPMYLAYLFSGGVGGVEFATGAFRKSGKVVAIEPRGKAVVQVMPGATYATCSIVVEGRSVATARATGVGSVVDCLG